jgi:hypothetical protein
MKTQKLTQSCSAQGKEGILKEAIDLSLASFKKLMYHQIIFCVFLSL